MTKSLKHIAFIMDGNRRWAKAQGLPAIEGHRQGMKAMQNVIDACRDEGVEVASFYAFSTENWRRSAEEVDGLVSLMRRFLKRERKRFMQQNLKFVHLGNKWDGKLPQDIVESITSLEADTAHHDGMTVCVALNYGGRDEILRASEKAVQQGGDFAGYLDTAGLPDVDVLVRTGGEKRLSNFLLWQLAYAELFFVDAYWPNFGGGELAEVLMEFDGRERRFGGTV